MKKLFKEFIPRTTDAKGNTIEQGYFKVSDKDLKEISKLNNSLKKARKK